MTLIRVLLTMFLAVAGLGIFPALVADVMAAEQNASVAASELAALHEKILKDPGNTRLSLQYAKLAETAGKPRLALVAYERVLLNDPANSEAQEGAERIRQTLRPSQTRIRAQIGGGFDSNPLNLAEVNDNGDIEAEPLVFLRVNVGDQRELGPVQWRTQGAIAAEHTLHVDEVTYGFGGVQTGPVFNATPQLSFHPAVGAAATTLEREFYYVEGNVGLTVQGRYSDITSALRLRSGYREYGDQVTGEQGYYAEAVGTVLISSVIASRDYLLFNPWIRLSEIEGTVTNFQNRDIEPGRYREWGGEIGYYWEVIEDLTIGPSVIGRQRVFEQVVLPDDHRKDDYFSPGLTATLGNMFDCSCELEIDYRYRINRSNDNDIDYDGHRATISVTSRL